MKNFLKRFLGENLLKFFMIFIYTAISTVLTLFNSLLISFVIDNVIDEVEITNTFFAWFADTLGGVEFLRQNMYLLAIVLIVINLFVALFIYIRIYQQSIVSEGLVRNIKEKMYAHIHNLPFEYLSEHNSGDLIQRSTSDIDTVRKLINGKIQEMFRSLVSPIIAAVILFNINFRLALIAVVTLPVIFLYAYLFFRRVQKLFKLSDEADGALSANIQESLNGIRITKAFNNERHEIDKFNTFNQTYKDTTFGLILNLGRYYSINTSLCFIQIFLVIIFGIIMVNNNELSYGALFVFITYESQIVWPIRNLGRLLNDYGKTTIAVGRIEEILNIEEEDLTSGERYEIDGNIEFRNVSFNYPDSKQLVLKDISFDINAGETIAIIGKTGSGKSSIVYLLEQLYNEFEGEILVDGKDIREFNKNYLRKKIGVVLQEPFLFSKTIHENVIIANKTAGNKQIEMATKIADINHVIKSFDEGFSTMVGENGVTLSGGQKQRLAIARTIINESPVLIFDDSLSAVDANTDRNIRESLNQLNNNNTMIIITQRINSCKDADKIIVLEDGKISNIGTHEDLIKVDGLYKKVYDIQSEMIGGADND